MDELVAAGARLRAAAPTPAPKFDRVTARARRHQRRRRLQAATAGVLAVALATVGVWVGARAARHTVRTEEPTTAPHRVAALSPQLRAHVGLDVPKGWVPVDVGAVRVWVPPASIFGCQPGGRCVGRTIILRDRPSDHTGQFVSIRTPVSTASNGEPSATINGYPVWATGVSRIQPPTGSSAAPVTMRTYEVPALRAVITVSDGADASRVWRSLAPSARTVVLSSTKQPAATSNWRTIVDRGVSFLVPRSWRVVEASGMTPCRGAPAHSVTIGQYRGPFPSCPAFGTSGGVASTRIDRISTVANFTGDPPPSQTVRIGGRLLREWTDLAAPTTTVVITVDGVHGIQFDLGADGRVDAAIIASLRYAPPRS